MPPYRRSYLIDRSALAWYPYRRNADGFDDMPGEGWHRRPVTWGIFQHWAYRFALEGETPNNAQAVTDRVMARIEEIGFDAMLDRTVEFQVKPDERRLRQIIEKERAIFHRGGSNEYEF